MPTEVKILIEGTTNAGSVAETGEERTRPTITLVRDENLVMVVDPGILENQQNLVYALEKEGLSINDVNIVCITHSHLDHYRNIGMFPNAKTLEHFGLWDKESVEDWQEQFTPNIQILRTPGHDYTGITLLVKTNNGMVAICGDIFWKENYPEKSLDDSFANDHEKLEQSRKMVLEMADWIVPGHAGIYKVDKSHILASEKLGEKEKPFGICRKCKKVIGKKLDSCRCRPYLCFRCCECGIDCDLCSCSHKKRNHYT